MRREDILIVNDGTPFLKTIGRILEDRGHRTCVTDSPDDGLTELARKYFRLVIVKVNGRDADYLGLLRGVKDLNPEARLIILGVEGRLPVEAFKLEADDYILLPCRPVDVWRRILTCLKAPHRTCAPEAVQGKLNAINGRVLTRLSFLFHDLRTGLVSLQAACKLSRRLADGQLVAEVDQILKEADSKAAALQTTLEGFLQTSFMGEDRGAGREICDIREDVVAPVLDELWDDLQKNHVALENHLDFLPPHQGTVKGDKAALKSIFRNLINNATQYGGKGCSLKIDYDQADPYFRLQVSNSGPVPPKKARRTITSIPSSEKDQGNGGARGLGLGLRLSQEILRSYGGDIRYEPQSGGTSVQVILAMC